jgi:two-component system response regulator EvgA
MPAAKTKKVKKTVLVVDDNPVIRQMVRDLFLSHSFDLCAEAENGLEALEVARDCKPDLIILDLSMPVMNGVQAAPRLRSLLPKIPIILFSNHAEYLKTIDLVPFGVTAMMSKNDPFDDLLRKAHELMGD